MLKNDWVVRNEDNYGGIHKNCIYRLEQVLYLSSFPKTISGIKIRINGMLCGGTVRKFKAITYKDVVRSLRAKGFAIFGLDNRKILIKGNFYDIDNDWNTISDIIGDLELVLTPL